ncbi:hypothetical protein CDCA_CDCA02G0521 [Cyanidium caldarium]|uniref:Uncharacterized protein n=1 Tax=Cyanidium caldarium TaxID=2771 RepID=A0AAV9IQZ7_CYACA|nr:hypothetical protein CDCA_CDCA02G0521 [Cyanidium caldarium]
MLRLELALYPRHVYYLWMLEGAAAADWPAVWEQLRALGDVVALIDAAVVFHRHQLETAVQVALSRHLAGRGRARHLHTEVVFALAAHRKINEGLRLVGVAAATRRVLGVAVDASEDALEKLQRILRDAGAVSRDDGPDEAAFFRRLREDADLQRIEQLYGVRPRAEAVCTLIAASGVAR